MDDWQSDKEWSDRFIPAIKKIVGPLILTEATIQEDREQNTDLIVLRADSIRIACRVRKPGYFEKYGNDITIRSSRKSGTETELQKIIKGWGHMFFYAHSNKKQTDFSSWVLIDLSEFRLWLMRGIATSCGKIPGILKKNTDGSSDFYCFDYSKFPAGIVLAEAPKIIEEVA